MARELDDAEYDTCYDAGAEAATHAWGPLGAPSHTPCPYHKGSAEARAWWAGFNSEYAATNGY